MCKITCLEELTACELPADYHPLDPAVMKKTSIDGTFSVERLCLTFALAARLDTMLGNPTPCIFIDGQFMSDLLREEKDANGIVKPPSDLRREACYEEVFKRVLYGQRAYVIVEGANGRAAICRFIKLYKLFQNNRQRQIDGQTDKWARTELFYLRPRRDASQGLSGADPCHGGHAEQLLGPHDHLDEGGWVAPLVTAPRWRAPHSAFGTTSASALLPCPPPCSSSTTVAAAAAARVPLQVEGTPSRCPPSPCRARQFVSPARMSSSSSVAETQTISGSRSRSDRFIFMRNQRIFFNGVQTLGFRVRHYRC